ncbi:MAG TPA: hypothetical protein VG078_03015 [Acidimicrobiales bacterium]|nr:hypothetical protein [Acidimicrobiales bacterium]
MATCPAGKNAVAGGGSTNRGSGQSFVEANVALHLSTPFSRHSANDSWLVHAIETNGDSFSTWNLSAFVVCLSVS